MAGQVEGKVALVTGGASGIGAAIAELLAREGATVVGHRYRRAEGPGGRRRASRRPAARRSSCSRMSPARRAGSEVVAEVEKRYGRLDILVSNAGIGIGVPSIVDMTLEDWRRQTAINLDGVFLSVKHCLPLMRKTGGGSIIMMSSLAGLRGAAGLAGYCATKGGVRLFAKAIAMECASVRRRHPRQLGASRHHRHADLGQDSDGSGGQRTERADRSGGARRTGDAARPRRPGEEIAQRRAVSGLRCVALRDGDRTRHRRRHERGRRRRGGREPFIPELAPAEPMPDRFFGRKGRTRFDLAYSSARRLQRHRRHSLRNSDQYRRPPLVCVRVTLRLTPRNTH